jgi:hypothetical protein
MSTEVLTIGDQVQAFEGHLPRVLIELESVKEQPRIVLVLASAFIEDMVTTLCKSYLRNPERFTRLHFAEKVHLLVEVGRMSEERATTIDWIRLKRNKVAHSALFVLDNSHMPDWADEHHKSADKTFSLCVQVIGCFWNEHLEIFKDAYLTL